MGMAFHDTTLESELLEHFTCLSVCADESLIKNELHDLDRNPGLLYLSDEVLIAILSHLEPVCLLRLGSTCCRLFRVCSCDLLWTRHFRVKFYFLKGKSTGNLVKERLSKLSVVECYFYLLIFI